MHPGCSLLCLSQNCGVMYLGRLVAEQALLSVPHIVLRCAYLQ